MPGALFRFGPYVVIAALIGAVVWFRSDAHDARADLKVADARVAVVTDANASLKNALDAVKQARADNDAIAAKVIAAVGAAGQRENTFHLDFGKAVQNDPVARNWALEPVPVGVRAALRAREVHADPR